MNKEIVDNRIYAFDVMRIFASCAVIMSHISADFVKELDNNTWDFILSNILSTLPRFAVPMFLMMSGALLLDEERDISLRKMLRKTLEMLFLMFSWSLFYAFSYHIAKPIVFHEPVSVATAVQAFFHGHYHMWYLYVLVGLYLVTPLLRLITKKTNGALIRIYLLLSVAVCFVIPYADKFLEIYLGKDQVLESFTENFKMTYLSEYLTYYVLGWYLTKIGIQRKKRIFLYVGGIVGVMMTVIFTQAYYEGTPSNWFYSNNSICLFLYSIAVFLFIYHRVLNKEIVLGRFWIKLSEFTFGVYLIHCVYLFVFKRITQAFNCVSVEIIVTFVLSAVLSFLTVAIISRIPYLKKFVKG